MFLHLLYFHMFILLYFTFLCIFFPPDNGFTKTPRMANTSVHLAPEQIDQGKEYLWRRRSQRHEGQICDRLVPKKASPHLAIWQGSPSPCTGVLPLAGSLVLITVY